MVEEHKNFTGNMQSFDEFCDERFFALGVGYTTALSSNNQEN